MIFQMKMWISFLIPKIEDGNNFGVSIQEDTLAEIQSVESESAAFFEQISRYFISRGNSSFCWNPICVFILVYWIFSVVNLGSNILQESSSLKLQSTLILKITEEQLKNWTKRNTSVFGSQCQKFVIDIAHCMILSSRI